MGLTCEPITMRLFHVAAHGVLQAKSVTGEAGSKFGAFVLETRALVGGHLIIIGRNEDHFHLLLSTVIEFIVQILQNGREGLARRAPAIGRAQKLLGMQCKTALLHRAAIPVRGEVVRDKRTVLEGRAGHLCAVVLLEVEVGDELCHADQ